MVDELPDDLLYHGVSVDIAFADLRPCFGDLFRIVGDTHPRFRRPVSLGSTGWPSCSSSRWTTTSGYGRFPTRGTTCR